MARDKLTNLLEETLQAIRGAGRTPEEVSHVAWGVAPDGGWCRWAHFEPVAARITYDRGYGSAFINQTLTVVGVSGWWLERHEYDGSEWWEYKSTPLFPPTAGRQPTVDDLLDGYRGCWPGDVVIDGEDLPVAAEAAAAPALEGVEVRDEVEAGIMEPALTFEQKAAATVASAAEQLAREGLGKVFVPPEDVPAIMGHFRDVLSRATRVDLTLPGDDEVVLRDPTRHVFAGEAEVSREDGGQALIYTVAHDPAGEMASEKMFVRVQSWDETGEHRDLKAMGTRLRVTVEPLPPA